MNERPIIMVGLQRRAIASLALLCFIWAFISLLGGSLWPLMAILLFLFWGLIFVTRAYGVALSIGLLLPFVIPLPFLRNGIFSFMFMFAVCSLALAVNLGLGKGAIKLQNVTPIAFPVVAGYLVIRYLQKPALPEYALGLSMDISGFATWSRLFLGIICAVSLPSFITTDRQLFQLLRWLLLTSVFFSILFLVLMPFPDYRVIGVLDSLGLAIGFLRNGWLRLRPLSSFGPILIAASLLPGAFGVKRKPVRLCLLFLGLLALAFGAGRSGWVYAIALSMLILFITRRYKHLLSAFALLILMLAMAFLALRQGWITSSTPGARVLGFLNRSVASEIGAKNTVIWRFARWQLAIQDIKEAPFFGKGFGGIKDAMMDYNMYDPRKSFGINLEADVAMGTLHNGYISFARGVGIPACLLMIWVILSNTTMCGHVARIATGKKQEAAAFVFASLLALSIHMMTSYDMQGAHVWFFLGLSGILIQSTVLSGRKAKEE